MLLIPSPDSNCKYKQLSKLQNNLNYFTVFMVCSLHSREQNIKNANAIICAVDVLPETTQTKFKIMGKLGFKKHLSPMLNINILLANK